MQDSLGAAVDAAAISGNPSFLLLPSDPGPCFYFCLIPSSHVAQQELCWAEDRNASRARSCLGLSAYLDFPCPQWMGLSGGDSELDREYWEMLCLLPLHSSSSSSTGVRQWRGC